MQIALSRPNLASLLAVARRFGAWWLGEFVQLVPKRAVKLVIGRGRQLLVVAAGADGPTLQLLSGAREAATAPEALSSPDLAAEIDRFLGARTLARGDVDVGVRLNAESVFSRKLLLPAEAANALPAILAQELARKTPFKAEDIYSDHVAIDHSDGSRIAVWQWVVRRQHVDQALAQLGLDLDRVAFLVFEQTSAAQPAPFLNLRPERRSDDGLVRKIALGLCGSALTLALLAGGIRYVNQQAALDRLDAQITVATRKAQQVRALADQLQQQKTALVRLRLQRNETPGLIDLWEEVSRVLPPNSFLTEFRLAETANKRETMITMHGFSTAAASLVGILDGSPMLTDAALTSPIAHDVSEGRERFALQVRVKATDPIKEASR